MVRLLGVGLAFLGLIVLANSVILVLGGGLVPAVAGGLGIAGWVYSLKLDILLILLRWETVVDRQSRTVTVRARLVRTLREKRYRFEDFEAVEVRRLGGGQPDAPGTFAVLLVGPDAIVDVDDPGEVPSAALFQLIARVSAFQDRSGRLALAASLAEFTGLKLRDATGLIGPQTFTPRRPAYGTRLLDSGDPSLKISRVPTGARVAALVLLLAGTALMALIAPDALAGGGLRGARSVVGLLAVSVLPALGALGLAYRSSVLIDFPSRLVRRRGSFLGSRWDESYPLDQFEAVLVREVNVPLQRSPYRSVDLSGGRYELTLYDDRAVPRSLRTRETGLDRGQRCLASAETLAALCGLPVRVVKTRAVIPAADDGPTPPGNSEGK